MKEIIKQGEIENRIFNIRNQRVMIDKDLAELYRVETKYLNRQVKRNIERFPKEFMFKLNRREKNELVTNWHRLETLKHSSSLPYVFTEHGVTMLATVLNSEIAVKMSIEIIKTFVKLKKSHKLHKVLAKKIENLESKYERHDKEIQEVINTIHQLLKQEQKPKRKIGFSTY